MRSTNADMEADGAQAAADSDFIASGSEPDDSDFEAGGGEERSEEEEAAGGGAFGGRGGWRCALPACPARPALRLARPAWPLKVTPPGVWECSGHCVLMSQHREWQAPWHLLEAAQLVLRSCA